MRSAEPIPKSVVEPVLEMEKRVDDAPLFDVEPMAKRVRVLVVEAWWIESVANGDDEPIPTLAPKRPLPETLRTPEMVEEPVTANADVVAWLIERIPPPTALSTPPMVDDAVTESAEVVADDAESLRSVVWPVLSIVKSVVVAPLFEVEEMEKSGMRVELDAA